MEREDLLKVPDLRKIILETLLQIPEGRVTSYGDIAVALGDSAAARAVGTVMANNKEPDKYPCWRVVRSSGEVGKYSARGGKEEKIARMRAEGIEVEGGRVKNFSRVRYKDFDIEPPLPRLSELQEKIEGMVKKETIKDPDTAGGVDVSYGSEGVVAAYVEMDVSGDQVLYSRTVSEPEVKFPYIPGYLAFRELPILDRLLTGVKDERGLADLIFVDGNGLLHPRKAGLATHLGLVLGGSTIGIAKKLLCGKVSGEEPGVGEKRSVVLAGEKVGLEVKTFERAKPIYVSVGNRIELDQAGDFATRAASYKLPEPIRRAHKAAKGEAT